MLRSELADGASVPIRTRSGATARRSGSRPRRCGCCCCISPSGPAKSSASRSGSTMCGRASPFWSDSVYQAIASLRRILGDDPKQPAYVATVQRRGYRLVASAGPWIDSAPPTTDARPGVAAAAPGRRAGALIATAVVAALPTAGASVCRARHRTSASVAPAERSVGRTVSRSHGRDEGGVFRRPHTQPCCRWP